MAVCMLGLKDIIPVNTGIFGNLSLLQLLIFFPVSIHRGANEELWLVVGLNFIQTE